MICPPLAPSDYLIAVTNTDHNDIKEVQAGYGAINIDLGAPGTGAYNITNGGAYAGFGGTSSATPHVAGTAALLYSLDCPALSALTEADPSAAALLIKEAILAGVDPNASLAGITVTGGRLNVANSIQYLLNLCDGCIPASSVQLANFSVSTATITWNTNDSLQSVDLRWRAVGAMNWNVVTNAQSPLTITGLTPCEGYEYQVQSNCVTEVIPFGNSRFFTTDGCCTAPENVELTPLSDEIMYFTWTPLRLLKASSSATACRERAPGRYCQVPCLRIRLRDWSGVPFTTISSVPFALLKRRPGRRWPASSLRAVALVWTWNTVCRRMFFLRNTSISHRWR